MYVDVFTLTSSRTQVHVEISLPDAHGRVQILKIHTAKVSVV
jgi:ATP-dependent 26S proteasome regulatory subunit